ncbi:MAG TPA: hypothetical protein VIQ30_03750, partial [Pseudonocardia sp.]
ATPAASDIWYVDELMWRPAVPNGSPADLPFDVRLGGETARVIGVEPLDWDTFTRTVANGWGTATSGHAWTTANGAASERAVNGTKGVVTLPTTNTIRFQTLPGDVGDCEILTLTSASQVATGASLTSAVLLRYVDVNNHYRARLHFGTGGQMFASVLRGSTAIGATPTLPFTYTAGQEFWVRVRLIGHRVLLRVWPVSAETEPAKWHIDRTIDTDTIAAGRVGTAASSLTGNTNVNPTIGVDDFEVITPQRLIVQRTINKVVKAHAVATPLSLATPMPLAL